jgi:hypothetical protein
MRRIHLLRVDGEPGDYAELLEALEAERMRVGWLDLQGGQVPSPWREVTAAGIFKAVALADNLTIAVKPRRGGFVMKDLLREHFLGCSLVLVRGGDGLPHLEVAEAGWRLVVPGELPRCLDTAGLVATLSGPRPLGA